MNHLNFEVYNKYTSRKFCSIGRLIFLLFLFLQPTKLQKRLVYNSGFCLSSVKKYFTLYKFKVNSYNCAIVFRILNVVLLYQGFKYPLFNFRKIEIKFQKYLLKYFFKQCF